MDATQMISDSILESEDEESEEENKNKRGQPLAKLCILKNKHISETELPLFLGDNVLGRDPNSCNLLLQASSVSKQHATICISAYRRKGCDRGVDIEALVWDQGSMNGTRKGRLKLTPNVRYALSEKDSLVVADIPCQFVSCAVDEISPRGNAKTPLSNNNGVTADMPAVSGEMEIDENRSSKSFANGGPTSRLSLPEDKRTTPVRHSCLTFEQTPTQPQASLVPQSDSDSDGERGEGGERRHKALVSNTDSYKSSPTCSTFLSPTNKVVPESEDESPITPSSSSQNRHVSFSKEEAYVVVGRQQQKEKESLGVVDDREEDGGEEERAALAGEKSEESRQHVKQDGDVSLTRQDVLPVSSTTALTDDIPVFNMDSDTDVEGGEEEGTSAGPVSLSTNQKADQPADTAQFHMDSDTDVEEDNDALDNVSKSVLPSADTKHPHFISVAQPEGLTMDSDTDVDDDDAVSDAATEAKPVSFESTHTADSAPSTQPKDFHLDSDTDVDEEEEKECGTNTVGSKTDETPTELDIKPSEPESAANAPAQEKCSFAYVHVYSDTDDEAAAVSEPSALSVVTESITTADKGADLSILSDSDTDLEDESLVPPVAFTSLSISPATKSADPQPDSAADADRNKSSAPPAGEGGDHVDLGLGSDANVEDKDGIFENEGEDQIPSLCRENTPGLLVNPLCSTPLQMLEGQVEDMDTQAFLSPSKGPFRSAVAHAEILQTLPSLSDSNEDEDYVVAETQSFVLQTREGQGNTLGDSTQAFDLESAGDEKGKPSTGAGSFQSHLQRQAQALAMESTQAFLPLEGGVTLEETQAYTANSNTERNSLENDTQAYAKDENASGLDLEATQAYISEPSCDSEDEADRDEMNGTASAETQPLDFPTSSTLAMAETQPMAAFEEEESLGEENLVSAFEENPKALNETVTVTETQPMCTSDNEESDDEDSVICSRRRQSKPLQLEDEQTQTLTNSDFSALDTQPMGAAGDAESDEDSIPVQRKRKAKRLHVQDEESQTLTNSELSAAETPPMEKAEDGESDEEDSVPGPRKRKAKPLQIQEEESQPLTNPEASTVETELLEPNTGPQHHRGRAGQSAGTSSNAVSGKRGTRTRLKEEEEDQEESSEPSRRQTRGKNVKAQPTTRGRRGRPNESEGEEEEVEPVKRTRGKKSMRQQQEDDKEEERLEIERRKQEQEKIARERREKEEQERLQSENAERLRLEVEKAEAERMERERQAQQEKQRLESEKAEREKQRAESAQKDKEEQLERERKEQAEKERIKLEQMEKEEQERLERENKEKIENQRKEQAEKERLETAKRDVEDRLARERNEREVEREKQEEEAKEKQINEQEENMTEAPARSRRAARRTIAVVSTTQDSNDVPARRTRSRSNSSNSVSSERSASSVNAPVSRGRGRGRGATRTSEPPLAAPARSSNRRKTVAAGPTQHDGGEVSAQGVLSGSNSTNSLNSEISSCSSASQSRGRGARQRGRARGKQMEARSVFGESSALKPTGRGRKSRKGDESTNEIPDEDNKEQNDCQTTTRGRRQATTNVSEPAAAEVEGPSIQESATEEESPLLKRNVSSRVHKLVNKSVESPVGPAQSDEEEAKRKGRKRELEENTADPSSSCKTSKVKEKADTTEEAKVVTNDEIPVQAKRRGRASSVQAKRNAKGSPAEMEVTEEKTEEETVKRKGRGRQSAVQDKRKEQQDESGSSVDQDAHVEALEPQTPRNSVSRKRQAPAYLSPVAKTPRSSSASPAVGGRSRSASQTFKVLFTGVVDEAGERVLARLGGSMAKGVADMNCLVTDKVRRTVKFLCAVAKGVPIVTTHWLEKSGKAGSFLSPHAFIVKDPEQEKKFSFCLQESLGIASSQLLLQGYEIHVTKSVKPEPVHMKDIISCSGATFLPKMPSSHKPQTLVISCEEDLSLCGPALAASLPVVTAEFILTGILQQKLDLQTHSISAPVSNLPAAGGRGRKKT